MENKKELKYVPITMDNIIEATEIEMQFWPEQCAFNSYLNAYKKGKPYWLVYDENKLVGMSGLYEYPELGEPDTVWLGWFGVIKECRGGGMAKLFC